MRFLFGLGACETRFLISWVKMSKRRKGGKTPVSRWELMPKIVNVMMEVGKGRGARRFRYDVV